MSDELGLVDANILLRGVPACCLSANCMARTKDALKILEKVTGNGATVKAGIADARVNLQVAQTDL